MSRKLASLLAVVPFASGLAAQHYTISSDPWIAWAPVWVAQEKGMWKQHGVDVEVVRYDGCDAAHSLVAHKVDFCMAMAGTAVGMRLDEQQDVVALAEIDWSHGGDKMVLGNSLELKDLRGKRVGVYEESPAVLMYLAAELASAGLEVKDVEVVAVEDPEALASQVAAGNLPAAMLYEPFVAPALQGNKARVIGTTADFPGVMPECVLVMRDRLQKMPPKDVVAVLRGWVDAVQWAKDPQHEAEFLRIAVAHNFGEQKVTVDEARKMLENVRIHDRVMLRERNLGEHGIGEFLARCEAFAVARREAAKTPKFGPLFDPRWMREALGDAAATPVK